MWWRTRRQLAKDIEDLKKDMEDLKWFAGHFKVMDEITYIRAAVENEKDFMELTPPNSPGGLGIVPVGKVLIELLNYLGFTIRFKATSQTNEWMIVRKKKKK